MKHTRRKFLIAGVATGVSPFLWHGFTSAFANWPKDSFAITEFQKTLDDLLKGQTPIENKVMLTAPSIAENGSQVRVSVKTELPKVEVISLLVEKNPVPLTSQFVMTEHSKPDFSVNLKVRETSKVIALVKADGKFYSASSEVRVTAGGCS